ncbi:hypothetical protein SAMN05216464_108106 [Mucilaginibacter pineti]|uniref:Uncharacterized protein n=1 Tax=Mucilaginibacter pineti TaxID=1391627 RepID=A0A1G7EPV1_9SPHI|nr:hypothetical protein SAMN05216464_108106 [Mucilaginibacter pineti]
MPGEKNASPFTRISIRAAEVPSYLPVHLLFIPHVRL